MKEFGGKKIAVALTLVCAVVFLVPTHTTHAFSLFDVAKRGAANVFCGIFSFVCDIPEVSIVSDTPQASDVSHRTPEVQGVATTMVAGTTTVQNVYYPTEVIEKYFTYTNPGTPTLLDVERILAQARSFTNRALERHHDSAHDSETFGELFNIDLVAGDLIYADGEDSLARLAGGTSGMVLQTTGTGMQWVATSSLGIMGGGGASAFSALTDVGLSGLATAEILSWNGTAWVNTSTSTFLMESELNTSSELSSLLGDETGSGLAVFATNPLLTGFRSNASSTIGDGTATGGLTIYGGATTTGSAYFAGNVGIGIGTTSPSTELNVQGIGGQNIRVYSTDSTTGSFAELLAVADNTSLNIVSHSGSRTLSRWGLTLGGWSEIRAQNSGGSSNGLVLGTIPATPLVFGTNSTERARFDSVGNFGIGTTTPSRTLTVAGDALVQNLTATGTLTLSAYTGGVLTTNASGIVSASTTIGAGYLDSSVILSSEIDTLSKVETLVGGVDILTADDINDSSELIALIDDKTGSGNLVFSHSPTFTGITTFADVSAVNATTSGTAFFNGNVGVGGQASAKLSVHAGSANAGSEIITNGGFAGDASGWTLQSGCSAYASGAVTVTYDATCVGDADWPALSTTFSSVAGTTYELTFTVSSVVDDTMYFYFDNNTIGYDEGPYGAGTHTIVFTSDFTGTETIYFESWYWNDDSTWTIDNVSLNSIELTSALAVSDYDGTSLFNLGSDGRYNIAIGRNALAQNIDGVNNIALGVNSGYSNTSGYRNIFMGTNSGYSNTSGYRNIFMGDFSGYSNTTGEGNVFIGNYTGYANTTGFSNAFIGGGAGRDNTTGAGNAFFGSNAGSANTTGGVNTFVGNSAGFLNTTGSGNTFMGSSAGWENTTGSSNSFFGASAGRDNTTGYANSFFGVNAGLSSTEGNYNAFFGWQAGQANTTGGLNSFFGVEAGYSNTTAVQNAFFGRQSGYNNSTGENNTFVGNVAGFSNTTGTGNTFLGGGAGGENETGVSNVAIGWNTSQQNLYSSYNTIVGDGAGFWNQGAANTIVGRWAGLGASGQAYASSTLLGFQSGIGLSTGSGNILLGYRSGENITTGSNNILIGYDMNAVSATASNRLNIGNLIFGTGIDGTGTTLASGNVGISTTSPSRKFTVAGDVFFGGPLTATGTVTLSNFGAGTLQTDANGNVSVSSDERLKDIVGAFNNGSSSVQALLGIEPVLYHWATSTGYDTKTLYAGFSAQNVQEFIPEAVGEDKHGFLTLSDRPLLATVINAIKEIWGKLTEHDVELEKLREENDALEARLRAVEDSLNIENDDGGNVEEEVVPEDETVPGEEEATAPPEGSDVPVEEVPAEVPDEEEIEGPEEVVEEVVEETIE